MIERKVHAAVELKASQTGAFRAIVATLNTVDRDGDVTLPGAFQTGQEVVVSEYDHATVAPGRLPVGKGVIGSDQTKAWVDGRFFLDTVGGLDAYKTVKALGSMAQWSHGYIVVASRVPTAEDRKKWPTARRILVKLDVIEVSPVVVAAGVGTGTESIKSVSYMTSDPELLAIKARVDKAELARLRDEVESRMLFTQCQKTLEFVDDVASYKYVEVARSHVDPVLADLADHALKTACIDLEISPPRLRWFTAEGWAEWLYKRKYCPADLDGFQSVHDVVGATLRHRLDEIWIKADLTPDQLMETVGHEVRHIAQGDEDDAKDFGRSMRSRLGYQLAE